MHISCYEQVFHELARHLQTRRLIAGDSIYLDQDKSFYCVVDGMVQVYARTGPETTETRGSWDDEDMNGYQLLNEVGSGGTLSSLFTILSLFTEDVKMSWQDGTPGSPNPEPRSRTANSDIPAFDLSHSRRPSYQRNLSMSSMASSIVTETGNTTPERGRVRSFLGDDGSNYVPVSKESSIHHGTVARATEDTTLAVIPAEAFKRLVKKYPKATGHIVQGKLIEPLCHLSYSLHPLRDQLYSHGSLVSHFMLPTNIWGLQRKCCAQKRLSTRWPATLCPRPSMKVADWSS